MLILLAEDSKTIALVLRKRLNTMGHEVVWARDGEAAVDWFATGHPDLVVMDIEMPGMDGFEAVRRIREIENHEKSGGSWTPVVFLTAADTVQNLMAAIEAGGDDFLSKTAPDQVIKAKIAAMSRISGLMKKMQKLINENKTLARQVGTDAMTSLPNRRALESRLDRLDMEAANGEPVSFATMMIDVDNFKSFNDKMGHGAGDKCLERIGSELGKQVALLGQNAFAARYGGEEFVMVLENMGRKEGMKAAWAVCAAIEAAEIAHPANGKQPVVSVSVGVSSFKPGMKAREVLKQSDLALYEAKAQGRAQAVWGEVLERMDGEG